MSAKRIVLFTALVFVVGIAGVWAQADEVATDNQVLGIEAGFLAGYRLVQPELAVGQGFALNLTVANNVQVGFSTARLAGSGGRDDYGLLKIAYFVSPQLGFNIAVGTVDIGAPGGTVSSAVGAGVFFNAFSNKSDTAFSTALKFKLDYLADLNQGIDQGTIAFGLAGVFGL